MTMEANEYYNRGLFSFNNGDYADAIEDFTNAIHLNPDYVLAYNKRAWAYDKTGEADKAIADWEAVLRIDPTHNATTMAYFSRVIERDTDNINAYYKRGCAYSNMSKYDRAIADFKAALKLDPGNADIKTNLEKAKERYSKQ
jgi:tetratricopeptide (TPR) repeat protein